MMGRAFPDHRPRLLRNALAALLGIAAALAVALPADAQQIVARVNGEPITAIDVAQRTRLLQVSGKPPSRKEVLDELIDESLKIQTARRYRIDVSEANVDQVVANMASRMRADPSQFAKILEGSGISITALRRKLRADIAWNQIVRGKFQASLQIREKEVVELAEARRKDKEGAATTPYQYTLRPILLVVPRGAAANALDLRRREAEGLRTRFQNCDDGIRLAKGLREVVVREPIVRSTGDLGAKLREVIDAVPIGKLTPPEVTANGIEVFAICEKKALKTGDTGTARDVREELQGERFQAQGKKYLRELRRVAAIEIR